MSSAAGSAAGRRLKGRSAGCLGGLLVVAVLAEHGKHGFRVWMLEPCHGLEERLVAFGPARAREFGHVKRERPVSMIETGKRSEGVRDEPRGIFGGWLKLGGYRQSRVTVGQLGEQRGLRVAAEFRAVERFPPRWLGGGPEPGHDRYRRRPDRRGLARGE